MQSQLIGNTIGQRYQITRLIGEGGMATVYLAYDLLLQREIAVKFPDERFLHDPEFAQDFEHEMRSVARLKHPNVVSVYDAGQYDGRSYLVMEYVAYGSMVGVTQPGDQFPLEHVAAVVSQIAAGLDHAHANGLVHRDLKPGNVLVEADGRVKLTDFGLAKLLNAALQGPVMGTPVYMAPEQIMNQPATAATDIYALGVLSYEMLAGRTPFVGDVMELQGGHLYQPPPSLRGFNPAVTPAVEQVILRALHKDPQQRFNSAGEFAAALTAVARPPRPSFVFKPWMLPAGIGALVALLALVAFVGFGAFQANELRALVATSDRAFDEGRLDDAIAGYEQVIARDSGRLRETHRVILLYILRSRYPDAEALARKALASNGNSPETRAWLAETMRIRLNYDGALAEVEQVLQDNPELPLGYLVRGIVRSDIAERNSDYELLDQAADDAERGIELANGREVLTDDPVLSKALAFNARGLVYWNQYLLTSDRDVKRTALDRGGDMFNQAIGIQPYLPLFRTSLGYFFLFEARQAKAVARAEEAEQSFDKANEQFTRALASDPGYDNAQAGLGWVLYDREQYEQAIEAFEQALPTDTGRYVTAGYFGLNNVYRNLPTPDYDRAIEVMKQAIALRPEADSYQNELAWTYLEQKDYAQAEQVFKEVLGMNSRNIEAYVGLNWTYRGLAEPDYERAIAVLDEALAIDPTRTWVLSNRGHTRFEQARDASDETVANEYYAEAVSDYKAALVIDAELVYVLDDLGWVYNDIAAYDDAETQFTQAVTLAPEYHSSFNGLGWSHFHRENYPQAASAFRRAIELDADYANAMFGLGRTLTQLGETEEARKWLEQAVELQPERDDYQQALDELGG